MTIFLLCKQCGEDDQFWDTHIEYDYINGQGDTIDSSYADGSEKGYHCEMCDSGNILQANTQLEKDMYIWKHTKPDSTWSIKQLKIKERNKELGDKLLLEKL